MPSNIECLTAEQWASILANGKSRREAANYLKERFGVGSPSLLAKQPAGLKFYKRGKDVIYTTPDLDNFGLSQIRLVHPTSQASDSRKQVEPVAK
jgi:hypothetical protein